MATKRNANFKHDEISALLEEVEKKRAVIFGKHDNEVTNSAKKRAWECIADEVSNVGGVHRDVQCIKKKWSDMKSQAKKRAAENRRWANQTGGGPPMKGLDEVEDKIISLLGTEATEGIADGIDSSAFCFNKSPETESSHQSSTSTSTNQKPEKPAITTELPKVSPKVICVETSKPRQYIDNELLALEYERLEVEKERLEIEKARLAEERARRNIEEQRLQLEQQHLSLYNICTEMKMLAQNEK